MDGYMCDDNCRLTPEMKAKIIQIGDDTSYLSSYIRPYIPQDIQQLGVRTNFLSLDKDLKYIQVDIAHSILHKVLTFPRDMYSIVMISFRFKCYQLRRVSRQR